METLPWNLLSIPLISALIGWGTNALAVKMIFHPHRPMKLGLFTLHGLIPRRQRELAIQLGETIESKLISHRDVQQVLQSQEIETDVQKMLEEQIDTFIAKQQSANPLIGMFLQGAVVVQIKQALVSQVTSAIPEFLDRLLLRVEEKLSFKEIIRQKVESFDLQTLEDIIYKISARELRTIELLGGVLGFFIGVLQVGLLFL